MQLSLVHSAATVRLPSRAPLSAQNRRSCLVGVRQQPGVGRTVVRKASDDKTTPVLDFDFDAALMQLADKFEKAENKPAVVGYSVGAIAAVFILEWLIHLPVLDVLLGFPVQLAGVFLVPWLAVRYVIDGKDWVKDAESVVDDITSKLPGLK